MELGAFSLAEWLVLVERELLLFAGVFFLIESIDELAIDFVWLWLRLTGRERTRTLPAEGLAGDHALAAQAAVFIPAWSEAGVIGATVRHMLTVWPQEGLRVYVGCYRNDMATAEAVIGAAEDDPRLRLVIHDRDGPSTKADCLNRLYRALATDEARAGVPARMVLMHDAEDMVDPAALGLLDVAIADAGMVQLPVVPAPLRESRWIASHYCEEFAEAHGKAMVVRDALGAGVPTAGVGCAIARDVLNRLAGQSWGEGPFAAECLTEDYELGLAIADMGVRTRFLRARTHDGRLIATRACFPMQLDDAVRQKTRWVHGIAFQSWDRLGWSRRPVEMWMRLRDRRGPLTALVLALAYALLVLATLDLGLTLAGVGAERTLSPLLSALVIVNLAGFLWRAGWRFAFTARIYGWREGFRAVVRTPLANVIAIIAGRRAFLAYLGTLRGRTVRWDKTRHVVHPALLGRTVSVR